MSQQSLYSPELADEICDLLCQGMSLVQICRLDNMPDRSTVLRWMQDKPEFAAKITRAREGGQADYLLDDISRIEDAVEAGTMPPDSARLLISSKQWRAMKLAPKRYGERTTVDTNATVTVQHTRRLDISRLTDDQLDALEIALRETVAQLEAPKRTIDHED